MDNVKPWYLSRTIWASLTVVMTAVAGLLGFTVEAGDAQALTDALLQAVAAVAGVIAILGRLGARVRIG